MALTKLTKVARKAEQGYFCQYVLNGETHEFRITKAEYNGMGKNADVQSRIPEGGRYTGGYSKYEYETLSGDLEDGQYADDKEGYYRVKDSRVPYPFKVDKTAFTGDSVDRQAGAYKDTLDVIDREIKGITNK